MNSGTESKEPSLIIIADTLLAICQEVSILHVLSHLILTTTIK